MWCDFNFWNKITTKHEIIPLKPMFHLKGMERTMIMVINEVYEKHTWTTASCDQHDLHADRSGTKWTTQTAWSASVLHHLKQQMLLGVTSTHSNITEGWGPLTREVSRSGFPTSGWCSHVDKTQSTSGQRFSTSWTAGHLQEQTIHCHIMF